MSEFIHDEKSSNSDDKVNDMEKNDSTWGLPYSLAPLQLKMQCSSRRRSATCRL
ncbi:hypothetical protein PILCRDRAFT_821288 [Piloderma croceum F 1598]|uniref:Uncharacterized protein n=1 Tax=Piloderma croceum (strain F 1598) TaxID=765440 RepID=A0A0C3B5H6_PILCF|nr:hypothetical protein PILCRDRAFT_821288 [Piloderma croceum F 1598]